MLLALCVCMVAVPLARAADDAAEEEARKLYVSAFREGLEPAKRLEALEKVARDYADSRWADDALWVLAQAADHDDDVRRAVLMRRQLLERTAPPSLEPYTQTLPVYDQSRIPRVIFLLERTGDRYSNDGKHVISFNPLPMVTSEELALSYERLEMYELALQEYRRAIQASPPEGLFARIYARRVQELEKKLEVQKKREKPAAEDKPKEGDAVKPPAQPGADAPAGEAKAGGESKQDATPKQEGNP